jgi:DNA-binding HxlR family transcriptional regulator
MIQSVRSAGDRLLDVSGRSYEQYCALARALDVIGERWTMLVLRELLAGPLRFADLSDRLRSISTDVLTRRLRTLEDAGMVERVELPPPAARVVYQLTAHGRRIEPVVVATARFGFPLLGEPRPDDAVDVRWLTLAVRTLLDGRHPPRDLTVRFDTPQGSAAVRIGAGGVSADPGDDPDVVLRADIGTLAAAVDPARAAELVASGSLTVDGDTAAVRALAALLDPAREPVPAVGAPRAARPAAGSAG